MTNEDPNEGLKGTDAPKDREAWRPIDYRTTWLSRVLRAVGGLIGFIILAPIVLIALLIFFMRAEHGPDVLAKVTVDIEVDGEPVLIERIVECQTFEVPAGNYFSRLWRRAPTRYFPVVRGIGARLKSGGAIMMYTPYLCDNEVSGTWPFQTVTVTPNPPGALTMMAWTRDANDPEVLEIYASQAYFKHPEARVKINRVVVSDPFPGSVADPPGEFSWFAPKRVYYKRPKQLGVAKELSKQARRGEGRGYKAAAFVPIPERAWGENGTLSAALEVIQKPTTLMGEALGAASNFISRGYARPVDALGWSGRMAWLPKYPQGNSQSARHDFFSASYPMLFDEAGLHLQHIASSPYFRAEAYPLPISNGSRAMLVYGDQTLGEIPLSSSRFTYIYDPEKKVLFVVWFNNFSFESK